MRFLLIVLIALALVPGVNAVWVANTDIVSGLGDIGDRSAPCVFHMDGTLYLISGENTGTLPSFNRSSGTWVADNNINSSLPDVGFASAPTCFYLDDILHMMVGTITADMPSFNRSGGSWQPDNIINSSLSFPAGFDYVKPNVFVKEGVEFLLYGGDGPDHLFGYNRSSGSWLPDYNINITLVEGLCSLDLAPHVFFKDGSYYNLLGSRDTICGSNLSGLNWQDDSSINASFSVSGDRSTPTIFILNGELYAIIGNIAGTFEGYKWNESTTPATPTIHSPSGTTTNTSIIFNATSTDDVCFRWYNNSELIINCDTPINSSGLVGAWHLGEGNGNSWISNENVSDYSGNSNDGVINGSEYVCGRFEKGMEFDGVDDYIKIQTLNLSGEDEIGISFWIKFNSLLGSTLDATLISNADNFYLVLDSPVNKTRCLANNGSGFVSAFSSSVLVANTWYQGACVFNTTHLIPYLNGVQDGTPVAITGTLVDGNDQLILGNYLEGDNRWNLNGTLDEVRIYNRSLSASEILDEYNLAQGYYEWNTSNPIDGNITFQVNASDSYTNSSTATSSLDILLTPDICEGNNDLQIYTFNLMDEETLDTTTGFIGATLTITHDGTDYEYSVSNSSVDYLDICVDAVWDGDLVDMDVSFHNGTTWPLGSWYVRGHTINSTTAYEDIALLNTTFTTESYIYVISGTGQQIENYFVTLLVYNYANSSWETLRMSQTDSVGKAVFNLRRDDRYYSFYVYNEDMTYQETFSNYIITGLETTLRLASTAFSYLTAGLINIDYSCDTSVNTSINCTVTDNNDPLRVTRTILKVWEGGAVNFTEYCTATNTSNPANVSCAIDPTEVYWYVLKVDMNPPFVLDTGALGELGYTNPDFGALGIFLTGLTSLTLGFVGAYNPMIFALLIFVGFVLSVVLDLIHPTNLMTISLLGTLTALVMWRLKR